MNDESLQKALNLCYFYLKFRPRTEKEIRDYLARKAQRFHFEQTSIDEAVSRLKEEKLINDEEFISLYIRSKLVVSHQSLNLVRSNLVKLGISKELIAEHLEKEEIDELEPAFEAIVRKWDRWKGLELHARRQKAYQFLMRRGFSYGIAKQAVQKCIDG